MKYLFTLAITMSFAIFAQEDEPSHKYQPEANKAEYYWEPLIKERIWMIL